jgi:hypothetical protein
MTPQRSTLQSGDEWTRGLECSGKQHHSVNASVAAMCSCQRLHAISHCHQHPIGTSSCLRHKLHILSHPLEQSIFRFLPLLLSAPTQQASVGSSFTFIRDIQRGTLDVLPVHRHEIARLFDSSKLPPRWVEDEHYVVTLCSLPALQQTRDRASIAARQALAPNDAN